MVDKYKIQKVIKMLAVSWLVLNLQRTITVSAKESGLTWGQVHGALSVISGILRVDALRTGVFIFLGVFLESSR